MKEFIEIIHERPFSLLVSLPYNSLSYAKAAWEAGADAIKVHCNVEHHASQTKYGSFSHEQAAILEILKSSPIPVGIMPGADAKRIENDFIDVQHHPFAFLSVYAKHAPVSLANMQTTCMLACDDTTTLSDVAYYKQYAQVLEVSILPHTAYGQALVIEDLIRYESIIQHSGLPCVIPTQKHITEKELPYLKAIGASGIMIGAVVTTNDLDNFKERIRRYRYAIDQM